MVQTARLAVDMGTNWPVSPVVRRVLGTIVLTLSWLSVAAASAQPSGRLVVLRAGASGEDVRELEREIDAALSRALEHGAGFGDAYLLSPTPFEDVELAAGCQVDTSECLDAVARALDARSLLVRDLQRGADGAFTLSLAAKSGAAGTERAALPVALDGLSSPARVVPELVARVYGNRTAAPAHAEAQRAQQATRRHRLRLGLGSTSFVAGAALLSAGLVMHRKSESDHTAYERLDVSDRAAADRAVSLLDRARERASTANGLLIGSAVLGATGFALFLWDVVRSRDDEREHLSWSAAPTSGGATILISVALGRL